MRRRTSNLFKNAPFLQQFSVAKQSPSRSTFVAGILKGEPIRSSHRRCSKKKAVLENLTIFTGKHLCWSNQHRCFPVNISKFLRTPLEEHLRTAVSEPMATRKIHASLETKVISYTTPG